MYDVHDRSLVKLLEDFLVSHGYFESLITLRLERQATPTQKTENFKFVEQLVLQGRWDALVKFLEPLQAMKYINYGAIIKSVRKQQFMEALCWQEDGAHRFASVPWRPLHPSLPNNSLDDAEIEEVVSILKSIERLCSSQEFEALCNCLTLDRLSISPLFANWTVAHGRINCFSEIFEILSPLYLMDDMLEDFHVYLRSTDVQAKPIENGGLSAMISMALSYQTARMTGLLAVGDPFEKDVCNTKWVDGIISPDLAEKSVPVRLSYQRAALHMSGGQKTLSEEAEAAQTREMKQKSTSDDAWKAAFTANAPHNTRVWNTTLNAIVSPADIGTHVPAQKSSAVLRGAGLRSFQPSRELPTPSAVIASHNDKYPGDVSSVDSAAIDNIAKSIMAAEIALTEKDNESRIASRRSAQRESSPKKPQPVAWTLNLDETIPKETLKVEESAVKGHEMTALEQAARQRDARLAEQQQKYSDAEHQRKPDSTTSKATIHKQSPKDSKAVEKDDASVAASVYSAYSKDTVANARMGNMNANKPADQYTEYESSKDLGPSAATDRMVTSRIVFKTGCPLRCVSHLGASGDGQVALALGSNAKKVHILEYAANVESSAVMESEIADVHRGSIYTMDYNASLGILATASNDKAVRLISTRDRTLSEPLKSHNGTVRVLKFNNLTNTSGIQFASAGAGDCKPRVWDATTGTLVMELSGHADAVHGLDWIDANTLISGCDKSRVMVHDLRTANPILSYNLPGHVLGGKGICCLKVAHTQSGCMLGRAVVGCTGGIVGIFNPFESRVVSAFQPHTDDVRALTFSLRQSSGSNSTGVSLVTTSYDGTGALWDVKDADTADLQFEKHGTLVGHTDKILAVTASRDGHLVTSGADGCVLHWDT